MAKGTTTGTSGKSNKISLKFVVNGVETTVDANNNAPLLAALQKALEDTNNQGQAPQKWEVRNESGEKLDTSQKVSDLGLISGAVLMVSLQAGAAGIGSVC